MVREGESGCFGGKIHRERLGVCVERERKRLSQEKTSENHFGVDGEREILMYAKV